MCLSKFNSFFCNTISHECFESEVNGKGKLTDLRLHRKRETKSSSHLTTAVLSSFLCSFWFRCIQFNYEANAVYLYMIRSRIYPKIYYIHTIFYYLLINSLAVGASPLDNILNSSESVWMVCKHYKTKRNK